MRLNLNWFSFFFSPLEQFEISSYNTSLNYTITYPIELFENFYSISYNPETILNFFNIMIILIILKSIQLFIKKDGFIFLYIFFLVILTCINFFAFTDFIVYENFFSIYTSPSKTKDFEKIIDFLESNLWLYALYEDSFVKLFHLWVSFTEKYTWSNGELFFNEDLDLEEFDYILNFYIDSFICDLMEYETFLISYAWFLGYLFYKGNPLFKDIDQNPLEINLKAINKIKEISSTWKTNPELDWFSLFEDSNINYLINIFFPKYDPYFQGIKKYLIENVYIHSYNLGDDLGENIGPKLSVTWIMLLLIVVGIFLASNPKLLQLNRFNENELNLNFKREIGRLDLLTHGCSTGKCGTIIPSSQHWEYFIMQRLSLKEASLIYKEFCITGIKIIPELMLLTQIFYNELLGMVDTWAFEAYSYKLDFDIKELFFPLMDMDLLNLNDIEKNKFTFITANSSFINLYSITFCFIFILLIIYLIFNKALSNNSNSIVPNIYQMFGENIYKISLNLFYSVLGKNLSHPEFFIKINTIFLFLIISNVQGMIPYMNTLTSALTNTFFIALALFINIIMTLLDKKGLNYFLNLFMPSGCPIFLVLLLIPIEVISYSFRVVSLSVRLFANMMAGHTLLKVIVGFSWIIVFIGNTSLINLFPIIILFILTLLEFGVALIQAYIFTILSCIYLRDIFQGH